MEELLKISGDIASACTYLELNKLTHRDIATRNVIVHDKSMTIQVTDTASFMDKYSQDYYHGLPIRWLAPECIEGDAFSAASDVYSFAVCFWEILTYAQQVPHVQLSDDDLVSIIYEVNHNGADTNDVRLHLARPNNCSIEMYELMQECWHTNVSMRPSFHEICTFFQIKLLSFKKTLCSKN